MAHHGRGYGMYAVLFITTLVVLMPGSVVSAPVNSEGAANDLQQRSGWIAGVSVTALVAMVMLVGMCIFECEDADDQVPAPPSGMSSTDFRNGLAASHPPTSTPLDDVYSEAFDDVGGRPPIPGPYAPQQQQQSSRSSVPLPTPPSASTSTGQVSQFSLQATADGSGGATETLVILQNGQYVPIAADQKEYYQQQGIPVFVRAGTSAGQDIYEQLSDVRPGAGGASDDIYSMPVKTKPQPTPAAVQLPLASTGPVYQNTGAATMTADAGQTTYHVPAKPTSPSKGGTVVVADSGNTYIAEGAQDPSSIGLYSQTGAVIPVTPPQPPQPTGLDLKLISKWLSRDTSRAHAEFLIQNEPLGTFLVRNGKHGVVVSLRTRKKVAHLQVVHNSAGLSGYCLVDNEELMTQANCRPTLPELVKFCYDKKRKLLDTELVKILPI
eukprot:m.92222 g.92222  ORF g.92222 m.92222 type:complete len:438 (+) comp12981_c1_seq1:481-1794(+)